ncbi:DUF4651 domain-containing protein [Streptococcus oricebi]|uniref:DUF4651 domain-containing protein n=1 Tax=Streptococcus oricebi TaxID=1547447 RepID=A0ABS5B436_9STRE|nr:DUF4651 domain-containing protein [Streptococcus oricebi]MBP2623593.1 DUF4651 domain-containing protein [Streptococcus oricebi]
MKAKKFILTTTALLGAGALAYGASKLIEEQKRLASQQELVQLVRDFFQEMGEIATVYVQLYESSADRLVGGVIFEDQRHFTFLYENGELSYEKAQG